MFCFLDCVHLNGVLSDQLSLDPRLLWNLWFPTRQIMVLPRQPGLEVLLLLWGSWGCWSSPVPLIPCPEACVCLDHTLINCSSSGLPHIPRHPSMDRTAGLDLSHNLLSSVALRRPNTELRALRLGNNQISYLSLCLDKWSSDGDGHRMRSPGAWRNQRSPRCVSWAPGLLLLSMERNRLAETPRGESHPEVSHTPTPEM